MFECVDRPVLWKKFTYTWERTRQQDANKDFSPTSFIEMQWIRKQIKIKKLQINAEKQSNLPMQKNRRKYTIAICDTFI
jgi:hypothetical protein